MYWILMNIKQVNYVQGAMKKHVIGKEKQQMKKHKQ